MVSNAVECLRARKPSMPQMRDAHPANGRLAALGVFLPEMPAAKGAAKVNDAQLQRYSRHIMLDDIGVEGQRRLMNSSALIVGAGGLGCPAALYLAAAGVGRLTICDDDAADLTNLQRQILHTTARVGIPKVNSAKTALADLNPEANVRPMRIRVDADSAGQLAAEADVVLDCSDNYATRHLLNRACARARTPLVFGAAIGMDGQAAVFDFRRPESPCYNCLFSQNDDAPDARCALLGVFAPLTGIIGCVQAGEALKILANPNADSSGLCGRLLLADARGMRMREVKVPRDAACEVCGGLRT